MSSSTGNKNRERARESEGRRVQGSGYHAELVGMSSTMETFITQYVKQQDKGTAMET
jgi:hypothetical protein